MKLWLLYAQVFDEEWSHVDGGYGRGEIVGACLDGEEAEDVARRRTVSFYRDAPALFARMHEYALEEMREAGVWPNGLADMSDDDVWAMCVSRETQRVLVEERTVDGLVDVAGLAAHEREAAVEGLAALLEPLAPGAAAVLREGRGRR